VPSQADWGDSTPIVSAGVTGQNRSDTLVGNQNTLSSLPTPIVTDGVIVVTCARADVAHSNIIDKAGPTYADSTWFISRCLNERAVHFDGDGALQQRQ
jgi:hypothetical protein